jgi:uncharacterized membrane protein YhdT
MALKLSFEYLISFFIFSFFPNSEITGFKTLPLFAMADTATTACSGVVKKPN